MSKLQRHRRIHSGEKSFVCQECGHAFTHADYLRCHMTAYHKCEKWFKCNVCSHICMSKVQMKWHLQNHRNQPSNFCTKCKVGLETRALLLSHCRRYKCAIPDTTSRKYSVFFMKQTRVLQIRETPTTQNQTHAILFPSVMGDIETHDYTHHILFDNECCTLGLSYNDLTQGWGEFI